MPHSVRPPQLRQREMPRFDAQLLLAADVSRGHRAALPVRELHDATPERHVRAGRQSAPAIRRQNVGAQRAGRCSFSPVLGPVRRTGRDISRVEPGDVAVGRAHPEPIVSLFQHVEHLAVQDFARARRRKPGLAEQRRERRRDDRGGRHDAIGRGNQLDFFDEACVGGQAAQRIARVAARRDATHPFRQQRDLEHSEPAVRRPFAPDVVDRALDLIHVAPRARPPRAPRERRSRPLASQTSAAPRRC